MNNKLIFNNLSLIINGNKNLNNYSETFSIGDRIRLKGKSGSGKSMLLEGLFSLRKLSFDSIVLSLNEEYTFLNKALDLKELRSYMGYLPQNPKLEVDNLNEFINIYTDNKRNLFQEYWNLIFSKKNFSIKEFESFKNLSGGEKQVAFILAHMLSQKLILLLDEPFHAIDLDSRREIEKFIIDKQNEKIIFFTHHLEKDSFLDPNKEINFT